jgi:hypothetical protein
MSIDRRIQIAIPDVPLPAKLSMIGAALEAVRLAHRDTIRPRAWQSINQAERLLGEAILHSRAEPPKLNPPPEIPIFLPGAEN